jgi:hypothetical protein
MQKIIENFKEFLKEETEFIDDLAWPKEWVDEQREIAAACKTMECSPQDIKRMLKGKPIVVPELEWFATDKQQLEDKVDKLAAMNPSYMLKTLDKVPKSVLLKLRNITDTKDGQGYINLQGKIDFALMTPAQRQAYLDAQRLKKGGTVTRYGKTRVTATPIKEIKTIIIEEVKKELKKINEAYLADAPGEFEVMTRQQRPDRFVGPLDDDWYLQFSKVDPNIEKCLAGTDSWKCPGFAKKMHVPLESEAEYYDKGYIEDDIYDRHYAWQKHKARGTKAKKERTEMAKHKAKSIAVQKKILRMGPVRVLKAKANVCAKMRGKCSGGKLGLWGKIFGGNAEWALDAFWCDYCKQKFCNGEDCNKFMKWLAKEEQKVIVGAEQESWKKSAAAFAKARKERDLG